MSEAGPKGSSRRGAAKRDVRPIESPAGIFGVRERADYGAEIVVTLSRQLAARYGRRERLTRRGLSPPTGRLRLMREPSDAQGVRSRRRGAVPSKARRYCRRVSSDPDGRLDALLSHAEPDAPRARARTAAAGVGAAFGLGVIWVVLVGAAAAAAGAFVLWVVLPILHSGAW